MGKEIETLRLSPSANHGQPRGGGRNLPLHHGLVRKDYDPQCLQPYLEYHEWTLYFLNIYFIFMKNKELERKETRILSLT